MFNCDGDGDGGDDYTATTSMYTITTTVTMNEARSKGYGMTSLVDAQKIRLVGSVGHLS